MTSPALHIIATGPLVLIEDAGRTGHAAVGVSPSGAVDRTAYRLGARLVGQPPGRAALEVLNGGLTARANGHLLLALTGAPVTARVDGRAVGFATPVPLPDGGELTLGAPSVGLRTYVSVRGGFDVPAVLGSRSRDTLAGLGPSPVTPGTVLPIGRSADTFPVVDVAPVDPPPAGTVTLRITPGPRVDWFADPDDLARTVRTTSPRSDRIGIRFDGPPIRRSPEFADAELLSEGMVRGCVQIPPNGQPVLFLNDHPVTGGYPVIGVVRDADVDRAAQLRPGQAVRFRWDHPGPAAVTARPH